MLFNFIGCPQSGKTTTAAMAFASLKEVGLVAEFIPEQARYHIAKLRLKLGIDKQLILKDEDQLDILKRQLELDSLMVEACGQHVIVISDSSPLNSVLYMSEEFRKSQEVQDLLQKSVKITNLSFYAHPIPYVNVIDPNRLHSQAESLKIDSQIFELLKQFPELKVQELEGSTSTRLLMTQNRILFL